MREDTVAEFLKNAITGWRIIQGLIDNGSLLELEDQGKKFYVRKLRSSSFSRPQ